MKKVLLLSIVLMISLVSQAQYQPKELKAKDNFVHNPTNITFPLKIDNYDRTVIYAFDKKKTNIGITYKNIENKGETHFTIYVYPAGSGTEGRLRNQYIESLQSIANVSDNGLHVTQFPVSFKNAGYKINGYKAEIKDLKIKSSLSVYECGRWFFKIRITSENLDSSQFSNLETRILDLYIPTKLVQIAPLNPKADMYMAKAAFIDSLMLGSAMGSGLKKLEWAMNNVDSLERASGFPGLYLDLHIASLKEFVEFEKKYPNYSKTKRTEDYLKELNTIIDNGFLEEFIMEQYNMIMIVPENMQFDFDGFNAWKTTNPIKINLNERFYVLCFN